MVKGLDSSPSHESRIASQTPLGFVIGTHQLPVNALPAGLYLVSTPIGNLKDITLRALETLAGCNVIACEDTRTSGVLLKRYDIDRPKLSYTEHNADRRGPELLEKIKSGQAVALISDAGTPLVSDPGARLVKQAAEMDLPVFPIPGPSAPIAGLVASGLSQEDFRFLGFAPTKSKARLEFFQNLAAEKSTLIFFESPARIKASLKAASLAFGEVRQACIGRELTKMHETHHRGTLQELSEEFEAKERVKGEIVFMVAGAENAPTSDEDVEALLRKALESQKTGDAAAEVAALTGLPRKQLYQLALELKEPRDQKS